MVKNVLHLVKLCKKEGNLEKTDAMSSCRKNFSIDDAKLQAFPFMKRNLSSSHIKKMLSFFLTVHFLTKVHS